MNTRAIPVQRKNDAEVDPAAAACRRPSRSPRRWRGRSGRRRATLSAPTSSAEVTWAVRKIEVSMPSRMTAVNARSGQAAAPCPR